MQADGPLLVRRANIGVKSNRGIDRGQSLDVEMFDAPVCDKLMKPCVRPTAAIVLPLLMIQVNDSVSKGLIVRR